MDENKTHTLIEYLRKVHHILIGEKNADRILQESADKQLIVVFGRSLQSGEPLSIILDINNFNTYLTDENNSK